MNDNIIWFFIGMLFLSAIISGIRNRKLMSKRELFFRRIAELICILILFTVFHFKFKTAVGLEWIEIIMVLAVLYPLIKDIKQKNWRVRNTVQFEDKKD